jgi:hypothetical protein
VYESASAGETGAASQRVIWGRIDGTTGYISMLAVARNSRPLCVRRRGNVNRGALTPTLLD